MATAPCSAMAPRVTGRRRLVGASVDEDASDRQLDTTRLESELRALKDFPIQLADWRHLEPSDIVNLFTTASPAGRADLRLLSIGLFTGTAQACMHGWYWAPSAGCPGASKVDCQHLTRPCSRLHLPDKIPLLPSIKAVDDAEVRITCAANCHPLDLGARMMSRTGSRVAVVRYTSMRDPRNEPPTASPGQPPKSVRYTHCREDQIFFRTTYWQAFERMKCDINGNVGDALDLGGIIYTPGVGMLRGPLEEGALWYQEPPRADIIWVALPPRPQLAEQDQYAQDRDRNSMTRIVDRVFHCAAAAGVDVLVMPPLGCGSHGCQHPSLDVADIIHRTAQRYAQHIPQVCIGSDLPLHFASDGSVTNTWWDTFAEAVTNGRPNISSCPMPTIIPAYPKLRKAGGKDFDAMLEKNRKLTRPKPRTPRKTFL